MRNYIYVTEGCFIKVRCTTPAKYNRFLRAFKKERSMKVCESSSFTKHSQFFHNHELLPN